MREANEGWADFVTRLVAERYDGNASALAKDLEVSASTVTRWVDGATPEISRLKQLHRVTQIPMLVLLTAAGALDEALTEAARPSGGEAGGDAGDPPDVVQAIEEDPALTDRARRHLLDQYDMLRELSEAAGSNKSRLGTPADRRIRPLPAAARRGKPDQP